MADDAEISSSIYKEVRKLAAVRMQFERANYTLQPTALVHEGSLPSFGQGEQSNCTGPFHGKSPLIEES